MPNFASGDRDQRAGGLLTDREGLDHQPSDGICQCLERAH